MPDEHTVVVPAELYERCERNVEKTTFESVDQYIQFILSEVVTEEGVSDNDAAGSRDVAEEQLEALGYLNK